MLLRSFFQFCRRPLRMFFFGQNRNFLCFGIFLFRKRSSHHRRHGMHSKVTEPISPRPTALSFRRLLPLRQATGVPIIGHGFRVYECVMICSGAWFGPSAQRIMLIAPSLLRKKQHDFLIPQYLFIDEAAPLHPWPSFVVVSQSAFARAVTHPSLLVTHPRVVPGALTWALCVSGLVTRFAQILSMCSCEKITSQKVNSSTSTPHAL